MLKEKSISAESVEKIDLQNEYVQISVLPDFGGKISEIVHKKTGTQFLKDTPEEIDRIHPPQFGDDFVPPYAFGFDECFPNISPGTIIVDGRSIELHDHGELWSQKCLHSYNESEIHLFYSGVNLQYNLKKVITLDKNSVVIKYILENREDAAFDYIWSSHPLLDVKKGDEILLSDDINELMINWASTDKFGGFGDSIEWPLKSKNGQELNYSIVQGMDEMAALKLFTHKINRGIAGVYKRAEDLSLVFRFDTAKVPYLGLWLCYGGWPENESEPDFTVAIEPARGGFDCLQEAVKGNRAMKIETGDTHTWKLEISIENGKVPI